MASVAAEGQEFVVSLIRDGVDLTVIGIVQATLRNGLDEVERRRGVPGLAAGPSRGSAAGRRSSFSTCRRCRRRGGGSGRRRGFISRLGTTGPGTGTHKTYRL